MRIQCLTTFLDGRDRYEKDDIFTIADTDGARFVANGWAKKVGGEATAAPVDGTVSLDVQNAVMGVGDSNA